MDYAAPRFRVVLATRLSPGNAGYARLAPRGHRIRQKDDADLLRSYQGQATTAGATFAWSLPPSTLPAALQQPWRGRRDSNPRHPTKGISD